MRDSILLKKIKIILRMNGFLLYSIIIPLMVSSFLSLILTNVYKNNSDGKIVTGIVVQKKYEDEKSYFKSDKDISFLTLGQEQAENYLENGIIDGYFYIGDEQKLYVAKDDYKKLLMQEKLNEYKHESDYKKRMGKPLEHIPIQIIQESDLSMNSEISHFGVAIAMACVCSAFSGLFLTSTVKYPKEKAAAYRYRVAPKHLSLEITKWMMLALSIHTVLILLYYVYMRLLLHIPFDMNPLLIIPVIAVGVCLGLSIGCLCGIRNRIAQSFKCILISATLLVYSWCSGLFDIHVRAGVENRFPFMKYINPCTLLADVLYALYQKEYASYAKGMIALVAMCGLIVFLIVIHGGEEDEAV